MLIAGNHDLNPIFGMLIAVAMGAAMGALNGALVVLGQIPSIIVTLGTMAIYPGDSDRLFRRRTITTSSLRNGCKIFPRSPSSASARLISSRSWRSRLASSSSFKSAWRR